MRNAVTLLLCSQGVPLLLFGDEIARTQRGNSKLYCHDNEQSSFDWNRLDENKDLYKFFQKLINFRHSDPALRRSSFVPESVASTVRVEWQGIRLSESDWSETSHSLALGIRAFNHQTAVDEICLMMNAFWECLRFALAPARGGHWARVIHTAAVPPDDILAPGSEQNLSSQTSYSLLPRSVGVLVAKPGEGR
jgi:isoamylase